MARARETGRSAAPTLPARRERFDDLLVIMPAWNEEVTVGSVVRETFATCPGVSILVVDDGSTDATAARARAAGAHVLRLPINLGVGGAMRAGYKYAVRTGARRAVQLDADGQHEPDQIALLLAPLDAGCCDLVIGARFAGAGGHEVKGPRRWAIGLLSAVLSRATGTRLTDATSGLKASNEKAIDLFARDYPAEYLGDTVEAIVIAARAGLRVRQVGVHMRARAGGRPSHGPVKAGVLLARVVLALAVAVTRPSRGSIDHRQGAPA